MEVDLIDALRIVYLMSAIVGVLAPFMADTLEAFFELLPVPGDTHGCVLILIPILVLFGSVGFVLSFAHPEEVVYVFLILTLLAAFLFYLFYRLYIRLTGNKNVDHYQMIWEEHRAIRVRRPIRAGSLGIGEITLPDSQLLVVRIIPSHDVVTGDTVVAYSWNGTYFEVKSKREYGGEAWVSSE